MQKKRIIAGLCAGLFLAACGGVTEGDIENAARAEENEDQSSGLRLAVAQFWVQSSSRKETTDDGTLTTAGAFTSISTTIQITEIGAKVVNKVMGKTYVESADKNGFTIESVSQEDLNKVTIGNTTIDQVGGLLHRGGHVLFEMDDWVRVSGSSMDADLDQGTATHPINPRAGLFYTNDRGQIFKGEQAETVAGFNALKLTRQFAAAPITPAEFYATCFEETPGTVGKDVSRRPSCEDTVINMFSGEVVFAVNRSESIWVGRQLLLKTVSETEEIIVDNIRCNNAPTSLESGGALLLDDCTGTISFGRFGGETKTTVTSTMEVTKFGKSADAAAQPQIEDAK